MYVLILLLLFGIGCWAVRRGFRVGARVWVTSGVLVMLTTVAFFGSLSLWGEMLWFEALGYRSRFWTFINAQAGLAAFGALAAALIAYAIAWLSGWRPARRGAALVAAVGGAVWGLASWHEALLYLNGVPACITEPIFDNDAGFYLFTLPFYY